MIIEIIATGDEVLTGFTLDTNSAWLCQRLLDKGWQVRRRHTVGDRMDDLVAILQERGQVADVLLVNGGLGPTSDDKTTEAAAIAAGVALEFHPEWQEIIAERYASRGRVMPKSNRKQSCLPQGATLIHNPVGTACGFHMTIGKAQCYFTPGVPSEFKVMIDEQILPHLGTRHDRGNTRVERYFTFGVSESLLGDRLDTLHWPEHIDLGYRSSMPIIELKLISQRADQTDFASAERQLLSVIAPYLVGRDELNMPNTLAQLLGTQPLTILDHGSHGTLIAELAPAITQLEGIYRTLPDSADMLFSLLQGQSDHKGIQLAIGKTSATGTPLALWDGTRGAAQTLKPGIQNPTLYQQIIAFAAQDMLRRYLTAQPLLGQYETLNRSEALTIE